MAGKPIEQASIVRLPISLAHYPFWPRDISTASLRTSIEESGPAVCILPEGGSLQGPPRALAGFNDEMGRGRRSPCGDAWSEEEIGETARGAEGCGAHRGKVKNREYLPMEMFLPIRVRVFPIPITFTICCAQGISTSRNAI